MLHTRTHAHIRERWLRFPILHNTIKIRFVSVWLGYSSKSPTLCELIKIRFVSCDRMYVLLARARTAIPLKCFVWRAFYFFFSFIFSFKKHIHIGFVLVISSFLNTYMHTVINDTLPTNATVSTHTKAYSHCNVNRKYKSSCEYV